jgi:chlorite dismutase
MLPRPSQAYDDACDLGYTVVSQHTDERIVFVETDIVRRDGDILYWVYRPAREDLTARRTNALDLTLVIFND